MFPGRTDNAVGRLEVRQLDGKAALPEPGQLDGKAALPEPGQLDGIAKLLLSEILLPTEAFFC